MNDNNQNTTVLRHTRSRFIPRTEDPDQKTNRLVQRSVLHPTRNRPKPLTQRERLVAGDLPDWEPLPPGEIIVKRGA